MNNNIQQFDFKGAALRTLTDEAGEPWFVAKDVCDVLELSNVGQALARLDDDEKSSITLNDGTPDRHHPFGRPRDHQPHREGHRQRPNILHQPLLPTR